MLGGLRFWEILIILLVVVVLFGKDRLPHLGSSLGQAIRNFKKGFSSDSNDDEEKPQSTPPTPSIPEGGSVSTSDRGKVGSRS